MKVYKNYNNFIKDCKNYILHNNIKCNYFGWYGMNADIDYLKIDGKIRRFNRNTLKEE